MTLFSFNLWYNYVSQSTGQSEQLQCVLKSKRGVVRWVVFDTVIDVRDLADVIAAVLHAKVSLQFGPALQHQLQRLAVVKLQVWGIAKDDINRMIFFKMLKQVITSENTLDISLHILTFSVSVWLMQTQAYRLNQQSKTCSRIFFLRYTWTCIQDEVQQFHATWRFGVLQSLADLRGKTLDEGVHLVTGFDWILYDLHWVHQRWAASWGQLGHNRKERNR